MTGRVHLHVALWVLVVSLLLWTLIGLGVVAVLFS